MAEVKGINLHKRRAMGENVTGMKKGGETRMPKKKKGGMMKGKKGC